MVSKTFNRYIWLMNTFLRKKRLTFEEISNLWKDSYMGDGVPMPLRTFHQHRRAIEELFGVTIKCDTSDGYHYFIDKSQKLREDKTRQWLLNSFSLSNMIIAGHNMKGRILFENIPHGVEYLQPVIEAMQQNKVLEIDYQPFGKHLDTYHIEPYALKVFHQRWYILGNLKEQDSLRHLALDRVLDLQTTDSEFTMPEDFDAEKYYAYSVGIFVNDELKPQKMRIRVYGKQVESICGPYLCIALRRKCSPSMSSSVIFSIASVSLPNSQVNFWLWAKRSRCWNPWNCGKKSRED